MKKQNNSFVLTKENTSSTSGIRHVYLRQAINGIEVVNPDNAIVSPFGWHDTDGTTGAEFTITRGNNIFAYEDGDNFGFSPDGGAALSFNLPINPTYSAGDQSESRVITNLFYWNNIIHDVAYQYGFDPASGNFQEDNYGMGGEGSDSVNAKAQDGSGTFNVNMVTGPDGDNQIFDKKTYGEIDNQGKGNDLYPQAVSLTFTFFILLLYQFQKK
ncbi:M36 family metallopeptidase [Patiriisocius marinus]